MQIILDTANVEAIRTYHDIYNITGVTTNPSILAKEKKDFLSLFHDIKNIIGDKQLHIQVTADDWEDILKEAQAIRKAIDKDVFIKVPTTEQGIRAMKELKEKGVNITATAIYTTQQAMLAATVGADYVAPYFNRISNLNYDSKKVIEEIAFLTTKYKLNTKILAASFKNTQQIMDSLLAGAEAVTVSVDLLTTMVTNPIINGAVDGFKKDWISTYGDKKIYDLI